MVLTGLADRPYDHGIDVHFIAKCLVLRVFAEFLSGHRERVVSSKYRKGWRKMDVEMSF